jgi:hypothetical protein
MIDLPTDSRFHGNDRKNRQSPVIASPDKSGRSNLKKMRHTFGEYVMNVRANNNLPLQFDSRLHGNDKKTNRQSPVIASSDLSGRSNLIKIYNTFGEYVMNVGANNYLPLQVDSRFHGNDRKNRQSPVIASSDKSERSNPKKIYNTFCECVRTVEANNYLPLQLDSRFHGEDRKKQAVACHCEAIQKKCAFKCFFFE